VPPPGTINAMNSRARRVAALFGAAAVVVTTPTIGAGSASATGDTPEPGELCRARENIQFYDTNLNPSYVVVAGDAIRIDSQRRGLRLSNGNDAAGRARPYEAAARRSRRSPSCGEMSVLPIRPLWIFGRPRQWPLAFRWG
jgi:hypothetical protein